MKMKCCEYGPREPTFVIRLVRFDESQKADDKHHTSRVEKPVSSFNILPIYYISHEQSSTGQNLGQVLNSSCAVTLFCTKTA
jgi:hypothetical protein